MGINEQWKKDVGNRIQNIRITSSRVQDELQGKKPTLERFAELIDSNKSNVSRWERGLNVPNEITLRKIAEYGDMTVDELLHGHDKELRDLKGNLMPEGFRLFDYKFIGHHLKKLKDSPVRVVHLFIIISKNGTFYNCGIRSLIVFGDVDVDIKTANITILAENLEKNVFYNSAASSNVNLKKETTGNIPFINAESYISSITLGNKKRGLDFLNNLSDVLLKIIREKEETHLQGIAFKGNFHYFRKGTTKTISFKIDDSD